MKYNDLLKWMANARDGKHPKQSQALIVAFYYTGALPMEILNLRSSQIVKDGQHVVITFPGTEYTLPRDICLRGDLEAIKTLYDYAMSLPHDMYLFWRWRSDRERSGRSVVSDNVYYHIKKWSGMSPEQIRSERFDALAKQGLSPAELRRLKGTKTIRSVREHLEKDERDVKLLAKYIK